MGRPGSGQIKTLALSVPVSSLAFWAKHLESHGFKPEFQERFGEKLLHFAHPCGICYELVGIADDDRKPYSNGVVPSGFGIRGTHGITVSVRELENSSEFMHYGWNGTKTHTDGLFTRYEVGNGGSGAIIDYQVESNLPQGSWAYGEGTVHHCAFEVADLDVQRNV